LKLFGRQREEDCKFKDSPGKVRKTPNSKTKYKQKALRAWLKW
jgi:hypothetical protein